jgi:hypothetical protein
MLFNKFKIFFSKKENILLTIIIILNTLNLVYVPQSGMVVLISILIWGSYLYLSNKTWDNKKQMILVYILFSTFGILGENLIINSLPNHRLNYHNTELLNVPIWLLSAYASMVSSVYYNIELVKTIFSTV